jgi:DNA repair protein RecO (recombination protein O)
VSTLETRALVLRTVDFGESDRIAHLLTPATARLTVIAKGAKRSKRRFAGTLDLFQLLDVRVDRRRPHAMARLEQARLVDAWEPLRRHAKRFALACHLAELVDRLAPEAVGGREARVLFDTTLAAFRAAAARDPDARLRALLELRVLAAVGLGPELRRCVRCGRDAGSEATDTVAFHVGEGGPVCSRCARAEDATIALHPGTLRALEQGMRLPFDRLDRLALGREPTAEARALLARFLRFHVGFELRSQRVLETLIAAEPRPVSA